MASKETVPARNEKKNALEKLLPFLLPSKKTIDINWHCWFGGFLKSTYSLNFSARWTALTSNNGFKSPHRENY